MKLNRLLTTLILSSICLIALLPVMGLAGSISEAQAASLPPVSAPVRCSTLPCASTAIAIGPASQAVQVGNVPVLTLTKTASNPTPGANDVITFTIVVFNSGNTNATFGLVADPSAPNNPNFDFAEPINLTPIGAGNTGNSGTLPTLVDNLTITAGTGITVTFPATIDRDRPSGTVFTNKATVDATGNIHAEDTMVLTITNLLISKSVSDPTPQAGDVVTYTIIVTNVASRGYTNTTIVDVLPDEVTFKGPNISVSRSVSSATYISATHSIVVNKGGFLFANQDLRITFPVTVNSGLADGTLILNTARVTSPINITPTTASVLMTTIPPPPPILVLSKRVNTPTAAPNQLVTYTIVVTNSGGTATGARISDNLPAGITFVGPITFTPPGAGIPGDGGSLPTLASNLTIPENSTLVLTLPVRVSPSLSTNTVINNIAAITSSQVATPSTGSAVLTVPFPVLTLDKQVSNPDPQAGESILYTILVTNTGPVTANNGTVIDALPTGITFEGPVGLDLPPGGEGSTGLLYPLFPTVANDLVIPPNAVITITIPVKVNNNLNVGDVVTNSAGIQVDELNTIATDSATIVVSPVPPLDVSKQVNNLFPRPDEIITFTIIVTNNSVFTLPSIQIFDNLDSNLTFVAGTINVSPPNPGFIGIAPPFLATSLDLAPGESLTLTFQAQVNSGLAGGTVVPNAATATNFFTIFPIFAPFFSKTSDPVLLTIPTIGLTLTKQVDNPTPQVGGFANYTIIVTNTGDIDATDVVISDTLPSELSIAGTPSLDPPGAGSIGTLPTLATIPTLAPNSSVKVIFPVQVNTNVTPGTIVTNTAAATSTDVVVPVTSAVTLTVIPRPVNGLDILKGVSNPNPQAGQTVTYTIVVINIGETTENNLRVFDPLPAELTFIGPVRLTPPGTTLATTPPVLASGLSLSSTNRLTLTFPVRVNLNVPAGTTITNTATVTSTQVTTPEVAAVPLTVAPSPLIDLTILKQVNNPTPAAGNTITYTINLTNTGEVTLTNVRVADILPAGVTFVGPLIINPGGTTVVSPPLPTLATLPSLSPGSSRSLVFRATIPANAADGATLTNLAFVTSSQIIDPISSQVAVQVSNIKPSGAIFLPLIFKTQTLLPDLIGSFTLTPNKNSFAAGEPVQITAVITNVGTARADSFWVDFYINPSQTPGVNVPWNSTCSLSPCTGIAWFVSGGLNPGQSVTLTSTPDSYETAQTIWPGSFGSGTNNLHLFVDSWNPTVATGAVFEGTNESNNGFTLSGLTVSGLAPAGLELPDAGELPPRPQ